MNRNLLHHTARASRSAGLAAPLMLVLALSLTGCGSSDDAGSSTPKADSSADTASTPSPTETPSQAPDATGPQLEVDVVGDKVTPAGKEIKLDVDETLTITVSSDRAGELHVHSSPEQELAYKKGETTLELTIDKPGVVDVEDHVADALVAQLQVS